MNTRSTAGRPMPKRPAVVVLLLLAAGLAWLSAQAPPRPASPQVDPKAVALLQAVDDAFASAEGLAAAYRSESFDPAGKPTGSESTTLRLWRPNVYSLDTSRVYRGSTSTLALASDGVTKYTIRSYGKTPPACTTWKASPNNGSREIDTFNPLYWSFYDLGQWQIRSAVLGHWVTKWRLNDPGLRSLRYVGRETVDGTPVDIVEWRYTIGYNRPDDDPVYTSRLSIGPDRVVRRTETTSTSHEKSGMGRTVETVSDFRTTPRAAKDAFAYRPPAGAACKESDPEAMYTTGPYADLPIGSKAPDFTLQTARGETLVLSTFLERHKVVLMNYWGYG
jgi:hypothetical protein